MLAIIARTPSSTSGKDRPYQPVGRGKAHPFRAGLLRTASRAITLSGACLFLCATVIAIVPVAVAVPVLFRCVFCGVEHEGHAVVLPRGVEAVDLGQHVPLHHAGPRCRLAGSRAGRGRSARAARRAAFPGVPRGAVRRGWGVWRPRG